MASSASTSAAKLCCAIHFSATNEEQSICALTEISFDRIRSTDYSNKWSRLVCPQGDVACEFVATFADVCTRLQEASDSGVGFHRSCCNRFTDSRRYNVLSIKEGERRRRASQVGLVQRALSTSQKTPTQFRKYLISGENKQSLLAFLNVHWRKIPASEFCNRTVFTTAEGRCLKLCPDTATSQVTWDVVEDLACDHEEADTSLLLHASRASSTFPKAIVKTPDTDVVLLSLSFQHQIQADIVVITGTQSACKVWAIRPLSLKWGPHKCSAMLALHAFTGCDSVSAFKGKGKVKPLLLMEKKADFVPVFQQLGTSWSLEEDAMKGPEGFVCQLYGQETQSVNEARLNVFQATCRSDHLLPPNRDCLHLHAKRANYQAAIWRRSLQKVISAPTPTEHGWKAGEGHLAIRWSSSDSAPSSLTQLVKCGCQKGGCETNRCSCFKEGLPCTGLCRCAQCGNTISVPPHVNMDPQADSDTSDEDEEEEEEEEEQQSEEEDYSF